jgi:hypothetical protein
MILRITAESSTIRIFSLRNLRSWWSAGAAGANAESKAHGRDCLCHRRRLGPVHFVYRHRGRGTLEDGGEGF